MTTPVLSKPSAALWPEDAGSGGDVELLLTIDATGAVTDAQVQSSPSEVFSEAALTAARALVFEPAILDGGAVTVVLAYRYRFEASQPAAVTTAHIAGKVMTKGTRDVIALAQLSLADGGLTPVQTDKEGRFTMEVPSGAIRVVVTASGHTKREFSETLDAGQKIEVIYRIEPTFVRPFETVVRGQADRAELSRVSLAGAEILSDD